MSQSYVQDIMSMTIASKIETAHLLTKPLQF